MHIARKVAEAAAWLRRRGVGEIGRALFTETTLGGFSGALTDLAAFPLGKIPHLREPLGHGWPGGLFVGRLGAEPTACVEGRVHLFEGFLPGETAFAVRVLAALGARRAVFLAEGRALCAGLAPGSFLFVADRLDLTGASALTGVRDAERGPCAEAPMPPPAARAKAEAAALATGAVCASGVAALVRGPVWPSPAEARMLAGFGADAVAMGIGPELAAAAWLGLEAVALLRILGGEHWGARDLDFCTAFLTAL